MLIQPSNGNVTHNPDTLYQAQATYTCHDGYNMSSGDRIRMCNSSGLWQGQEAVCSRELKSL